MGAGEGIPRDRIVAVVAGLPDGREQIGSGFLIARDLVLTARHCTVDKASSDTPVIWLRVLRELDGAAADVAETRRAAGPSLDVAVLRLASPPWAVSGDPPSWARVDRANAQVLQGCQAAGYPLWQLDPTDQQRNLTQFEGEIRTLEDAGSGLLVMRDPLLSDVGWDIPASARAADRDPRSPWGGLSGAAVLHAGRVIGVVIEHHPRQGGSAVRVLPIDRVAAATDPDTRSVAALLGLPSVLDIPVAVDRDQSRESTATVNITNLVVMIGQGEVVATPAITEAGEEAVDRLAQAILDTQGLTPASMLSGSDRRAPAEHVSRQIAAVVAAQQELTSATGTPASAQAAYRLGILAAYDRDDVTALDYLRQATRADADFTDAFAALAWLQQSRAINALSRPAPDLTAIGAWLDEARLAARQTDPVDASSVAMRGFIAKTLAQIAQEQDRIEERDQRYAEAARLFEHAARLDPSDPAAQNGLGNVLYARGDLDGAITAIGRAVELDPDYTAARHDLALAFEAKANADPSAAADWLARAIDSLQEAYLRAPTDPSLDDGAVAEIGRHLAHLRARLATGTAS